jgi:hypothetical protein
MTRIYTFKTAHETKAVTHNVYLFGDLMTFVAYCKTLYQYLFEGHKISTSIADTQAGTEIRDPQNIKQECNHYDMAFNTICLPVQYF